MCLDAPFVPRLFPGVSNNTVLLSQEIHGDNVETQCWFNVGPTGLTFTLSMRGTILDVRN